MYPTFINPLLLFYFFLRFVATTWFAFVHTISFTTRKRIWDRAQVFTMIQFVRNTTWKHPPTQRPNLRTNSLNTPVPC